ncbi:ribonuclease CAF1 [Pelomyxa schiedti]|nr:ribonuclease CAF1 [Pelomyxa schiedti]
MSGRTTNNNNNAQQTAANNMMMCANNNNNGANNQHGGGGSGGECIRDVWAYNLHDEMRKISLLLDDYPCVAMDTEFPGVVARPVGSFRNPADYQYQRLRCNVDLLKIIQIGLTFSDNTGKLPNGVCTWQFNFKFNLKEDMYAADSIDLLVTSGIEFDKNEAMGIDVADFGELLMASGLVLCDNVSWLSFHSGYDFGYLIKILTCSPLPAEESGFFDLVKTYFPRYYDIKYIIADNLTMFPQKGLQDIANYLEVKRIGPQHQAGSDSLLTSELFFKIQWQFFDNKIDEAKYCCCLYGFSNLLPAQEQAQQSQQQVAVSASTLVTSLSAAPFAPAQSYNNSFSAHSPSPPPSAYNPNLHRSGGIYLPSMSMRM